MADDVVDPSMGRKPDDSPPGRKPEQPPTDWMPGMNDTSNQVVQIHREVARRSAVTGVRASTMPPPLATAFAGEGTLVADGQVVEAARATRRRVEFAQQLSDHPVEIRDAARALAQAVREQITELRAERRNDTESADFIEFLEMVARGLDRLVEALDRAIEGSPDQQPMFLGEAGKVAHHLKTGVYEYLEQHRADIAGYSIKVGLVSATAGFLHLCGFDLASIVSILKK